MDIAVGWDQEGYYGPRGYIITVRRPLLFVKVCSKHRKSQQDGAVNAYIWLTDRLPTLRGLSCRYSYNALRD